MDVPKQLQDRFEVTEQLVNRPNCLVFKGQDKKLADREVAIKFFVDKPLGNDGHIKAFESEVSILRKTSHPSLVPVLAGGCENDWFYLAMEYIQGPTLRETIEKVKGPFDVAEAVQIVAQVAAGVKDLHEAGGVHGHIDSRSIIFKGEEARLAGYYPAVLQQIQKTTTSQGRFMVDPAYIAPEQVDSSAAITAQSDIFSLSVLLYEMVAGKRPFEGSSPLQIAAARLSERPTPPSKINDKVSKLLDAAILKGLAKKPDERFRSVEEFIDAITGGKKEATNPLSEIAQSVGADRLGVGETVGVSMSTEAIKHLLRTHETSAVPASSLTPKVNGHADAIPSVERTMMGMSAQAVLDGGVMILTGANKGTRYALSGSQTILGSDETCGVSIDDKLLPARAALFIRKGNSYSLSPMGAAAVLVDDVVVTPGSDRLLTRGETIAIGETKFRYIAPGEVFTLDESVAERSIDKKPGKFSKMMLIIAGLAAVLTVLLILQFQGTMRSQKATQKKKSQVTEAARSEQVAKLRKEGDSFFRSGQLIAPVGDNARERFQEILELKPDDTYAKRRLADIEGRVLNLKKKEESEAQLRRKIDDLLGEAERKFRAGSYVVPVGNSAKDLYEEVLTLDKNNETARTKLAELDNLIGDIRGTVATALAKAEVYRSLGQYVAPKGASAFDVLMQVREYDPTNAEVEKMLYEMAADSIFAGDQARKQADHKAMKKSYVTAQLLGVDPEYLKPRLKGADLIQKSSSSVIIYGRNDQEASSYEQPADSKYLKVSEIEARLSALTLQASGEEGQTGQRFIDLGASN